MSCLLSGSLFSPTDPIVPFRCLFLPGWARLATRNVRTLKAYFALTAGVTAIAWSAIFVRWTHISGLASAFYRVFFAGADHTQPPRLPIAD